MNLPRTPAHDKWVASLVADLATHPNNWITLSPTMMIQKKSHIVLNLLKMEAYIDV
jgi:hypothetical protein